MKLKKLEMTYNLSGSTACNMFFDVSFPITKKRFQEMWNSANVTEREMMTQIVLDNKPDEKDAKLYKDAETIIAQYNRITGKKVQVRNEDGSKTSSLTLIFRILKKGYTIQDCLSVMDIKSRQKWFFQDDWHFFTIKTLFRASNFENYIQEVKSKTKFESYLNEVRG